MRVCISYTHLYSNKLLNHTAPLENCKMCFWANMQVASTLWPNIKSQIKSESEFRLKWNKAAQDSPLAKARGGWWPWAVSRPARSDDRPMGPTTLAQPHGGLALDHKVSSPRHSCRRGSPRSWLPPINIREGVKIWNTHHTFHLPQELSCLVYRISGV